MWIRGRWTLPWGFKDGKTGALCPHQAAAGCRDQEAEALSYISGLASGKSFHFWHLVSPGMAEQGPLHRATCCRRAGLAGERLQGDATECHRSPWLRGSQQTRRNDPWGLQAGGQLKELQHLLRGGEIPPRGCSVLVFANFAGSRAHRARGRAVWGRWGKLPLSSCFSGE